MFRVVLPPIIRSTYNCIYSIWYLSHRYCYLPLSWKSWNRFECAVGGVRQRNISCDAHLLNELLETDVPRDDAIVVTAGKLRELCYSLNELRSSLWKTTGKDSSEACQNCAVYSVFTSGMRSHNKIAQFNWQCIGHLEIYLGWCWDVLLPAQNKS
jgi:hypothetical protein